MLPPGGEGKIEVTLVPKGNHTKIEKRVLVFTNDPEQPQFALTMRGTLLFDAVAEPSMVFIRDLQIGQPGTGTFELRMAEGSDAKIESVTIEDDENFSIKKIKADSDADATYEVRFRGRKEVGTEATRVIVKTTGENTPEIIVNVRANTTLNLRYIKDIRFTRREGKLLSRTVRISARHGDAPTIRKVEDPDDLLEVKVLEPEGPMASIELRVRPEKADLASEGTHRLIVHTSDRQEPKLELSYEVVAANPTRGKVGDPVDPIPATAQPVITPGTSPAPE